MANARLLAPEAPWVGEHRKSRRRLHELLGLSKKNRLVIEAFVILWLVIEAAVIFVPFFY